MPAWVRRCWRTPACLRRQRIITSCNYYLVDFLTGRSTNQYMQLLTYTTSRFYFTPARNTLCRRFCQAGNDQDLKECAFGGGSGVLPPASCFANLITSTCLSSFKVWQPVGNEGIEPSLVVCKTTVLPLN